MTIRFVSVIALLLLGTFAWSDQPAAVQSAVKLAAQSLQIAPAEVTVVTAEAVRWPDSSLGVRQPGQMYLQVITPGYRVIVQGAGRRLEYHTDAGGRAVLAANTAATGPDNAAPTAPPAIIEECRADLAARLRLPVERISVTSAQPQVFPDASLGLARPDEMAAQALTPGWVIALTTGRTGYVYTASERAWRYGGPLEAWRASALYLAPVADEPNLNANLMQVALPGTAPTVLLEGVSGFWAQADGSVLATRRTSRSGFDLLYLAPGQRGEARKLASAFDFGPATVSLEGTQWAVVLRERVGGLWQLAMGTLGAEGCETVPLPVSARPDGLWWSPENPVIRVTQEQREKYYELKLADPARPWQALSSFFPPEREQFMLNKSETLVVKTEAVDGKPVTRVSKQWFTGDDKPVASIEGFTPTRMMVSRGHRFLLMEGERDEASVALTVDLATGEVLTTLSGVAGPVQLLAAPPQTWLVTNALGKLLAEQ